MCALEYTFLPSAISFFQSFVPSNLYAARCTVPEYAGSPGEPTSCSEDVHFTIISYSPSPSMSPVEQSAGKNEYVASSLPDGS